MKKQKLLLTIVLSYCLICICILQYNLSMCLATPLDNDILSRKELQKLISDGNLRYGQTPEDVFINAFYSFLKKPKGILGVAIDKDGGIYAHRMVVGTNTESKVKIREYKDIFSRSYDPSIIEKQYDAERALVDSICAFYEIGRDELIKIRKEKKLISRKKKEINQLFENCLELIDKKFIKNEAVLNEDRIVKSIIEKLIESQDKSAIPTVPTYPSTLI